jgi:hypothetical protein
MSRSRPRSSPVLALAVLVGASLAPGVASAASRVLPLRSQAPLALATAWDAEDGAARGEPGACLDAVHETRSMEAGPPSWSLLVLSRVGGRLLLGVYVSAPVEVEAVEHAVLTDAARRLARTDPHGFRALCGDGFVAARALGDHYVAEIEIDPRDAARAARRLSTGTWHAPEEFRAALEAALAGVRASARELPEGRRAAASPVEPAQVVERALAFPETVSHESARPYLGSHRTYPATAVSGIPIDVDPLEGWSDAARQVFLGDRTGGAGLASSAARAAEMRLAQVRRPRPEPTPPDAGGAAASPELSSEEPVPAEGGTPATPGTREPARLRSVAALVYDDPGGTPVYATTQAPPGVYARRVKRHALWVPGAAAATPSLEAALARAAAAAPARGTTVMLGEGGAQGVVLTDTPPAPGVHEERAGALHAWIAGVAEPGPAERAALAAAASAVP